MIDVRPMTFLQTMQAFNPVIAALAQADIEVKRMMQNTLLRILIPAFGPLFYALAGRDGLQAYENGIPAGAVFLAHRINTTYIEMLAVYAEYRRRGVGQALLSAAERRAQKAGKDHIALHVTIRNAPAVRLYEKNGYRRFNWRCYKRYSGAVVPIDPGSVTISRFRRHGDYGKFLKADLSAGAPWAVEVVHGALRYEWYGWGSYGKAYQVDNDDGRTLIAQLRGPRTAPTVVIVGGPEIWGTPFEAAALRAILDTLPEVPPEVTVRLGSDGHFTASEDLFRTLGFRPEPIEKMLMLKALSNGGTIVE